MQRLLQGDVGSGKTVVALYALLRAVESGRQGALMAPTETLAEQHFLTLDEPCRELGVTCALLTGSSSASDRAERGHRRRHARADPGRRRLRISPSPSSTSSTASASSSARADRGRSPHVLHMTATPIPRTLALTVYGDLLVSEIAKPPANRKPSSPHGLPREERRGIRGGCGSISTRDGRPTSSAR
jgi:ATP-dependent DNA helicase RecG